MQDKLGNKVKVELDDGQRAYIISYTDSPAGKEQLAGICYFLDHGQDRIFFHTEVPPAFSGRGLATVLIEQALLNSVKEGKTVVPSCPAVRSWLEKHEFAGKWRATSMDDMMFLRKNLS